MTDENACHFQLGYHGSGLVTDLYQLTMGAGFVRAGVADREAVFHLYFRRAPFGQHYAIAAGLNTALRFIEHARFSHDDVEYLRTLTATDGSALFSRDYLAMLRRLRFTLDVDAVREGTACCAGLPLLTVRGPLLQAQLVESALLNILNFQTLIATKAARICDAAGDDPVLEFGLRRAQGFDGGISASRAAYIGGCTATSNVAAGRAYGIPVKGTHAHSWVMVFDTEQVAFERYADAMPANCVLLVDTYDTLRGVQAAIEVGRQLRQRGHELRGIRLDSGDLVELSRTARQRLDAAGFSTTKIVASNDLDEHAIGELKRRGAAIDVWGVGTRLVTGYDQSALGGVYKLAALADEAGRLVPKAKRSDDAAKNSIPARQGVRRYHVDGKPVGDVAYELDAGRVDDAVTLDGSQRWNATGDPHELLTRAMTRGRALPAPKLSEIRDHAATQRRVFRATTCDYFVGLESALYRTRLRLTSDRDEGNAK